MSNTNNTDKLQFMHNNRFPDPLTPEERKEQLKFRKQLDQIYEAYHPQHDFILITDNVMVREAYQNLINPMK